MIQVETTRARRIFTVSFLYNMGHQIDRNLSRAISTKLWVETNNDMSPKKVDILQRNVPPFPWTRKALEPMISLVIRRGIKNTATKRSDAAMFATRTKIGSLILTKAVMRRMFPTRDANKVKTCIVVLSWLGPSVMAQYSGGEVLFMLLPTSSEVSDEMFAPAAKNWSLVNTWRNITQTLTDRYIASLWPCCHVNLFSSAPLQTN